jgi:hypothetical protein
MAYFATLFNVQSAVIAERIKKLQGEIERIGQANRLRRRSFQGMEKSQSEVREQTPYQVIREYSLFGVKTSSANADVVAQVDFSPRLAKITAFKSGQVAREGSRSCNVSWIMKRKRAKAIKLEPRLRRTTTISS